MTEILCYDNSYIKEFDAIVLETTSDGVILDRTAFYPGGGGQPSDAGTLYSGDHEYPVKKLSRRDGKLVHEVDGAHPEFASRIHGIIDWARRYQLMRTHTALHILSGVVWRDYGALVTGGNIKPLSARMDFELEHMTTDFASNMERLVNKEVENARPVEVRSLPREKAFKIPDLIRTKINLLPDSIKQIRIVDIVGLDLQADGGTHVSNTEEVGAIKIVGHESKGRTNKRLRIKIQEEN